MILGKDHNEAREKFDFELKRKKDSILGCSLGDEVSEIFG